MFILVIDLVGIDFIVSGFLYAFLNHHNGYNKPNSFLTSAIVAIVLGIIILAFYVRAKNKKIEEKKLFVMQNLSGVIFAASISIYTYYEGSYHNWINRNGQFWLLVSIVVFIVFCILTTNIFDLTLYALNPKNENEIVFIFEIIALLTCSAGAFLIRIVREKEIQQCIEEALIIFLFTNVLLFSYLNKIKKESIEEITGKEYDNIIVKDGYKVFISHSGKDKEYCTAMFDFLTKIGVPDSQIFYSSMAENGVSKNNNIFEYISEQYKENNLHIMFMLSENFYNSIYCVEELGASLVLDHKTDTILLPNFTADKIKGSIDPNDICISLDSDEYELKFRLEELKNDICEEFELEKIASMKWERIRDEFINKVKEIKVK